jgi:solute:Na+ symporter, SSS family
MEFNTTDYIVFGIYLFVVVGFGIWIANREKHQNSQEYFLAGRKLPWWAVGGSLIASNISAEQMIGMAGSGFLIGLAISSYEWMAAVTLLVVAKFLIPVYLKENIQTMPQFLENRFDKSVRTGLAVFWVGLFIFVNITSLFFLGSLALNSILGISMSTAIIGLVLYSATFSIFGGLKAVVWTDVIQVIVLIVGGSFATIMILDAVSDGNGVLAGLKVLYAQAPDKFEMIFSQDATYTDIETGETKSAYALLPGLGVLIGGMWIANLYYWGFNQYIIQRALAAKDVREAQKGIVFAAGIKILIPFIVVIPGIAAFALNADLGKADEAYPWVINNYVSTGFKGLVVAAIVAAIGSSISSMVNSTSTIYTLDIHRHYFSKNSSEKNLVVIGKVAAAVTLLIGAVMAPSLSSFDQIFQYIQKYTGYISPGILAIFIFGIFWKKTTTKGALTAIFLAIPLSLLLDVLYLEMAFLHKMGISFVILSVLIASVSFFDTNGQDQKKTVDLPEGIFQSNMQFNIGALIVLVTIAAIYAMFW